MKTALIVGLGNPGIQYEGTRHNIGFTVIEAISRQFNIVGKSEKKFQAIVGNGRIGTNRVILAQPLTFMNLSGQSVQKLLAYYDVPIEDLLVIYDEAALPFGRLRFRPSGSDAGQKGMRSIQQSLGGRQDIPRLRMGIGSPPTPMAMADYVLSRFLPEEQAEFDPLLMKTQSAVETWLDFGMQTAMERFNGSPNPLKKATKQNDDSLTNDLSSSQEHVN
jgi:peptidyl-tRNA hydrolase, PTH1 family